MIDQDAHGLDCHVHVFGYHEQILRLLCEYWRKRRKRNGLFLEYFWKCLILNVMKMKMTMTMVVVVMVIVEVIVEGKEDCLTMMLTRLEIYCDAG